MRTMLRMAATNAKTQAWLFEPWHGTISGRSTYGCKCDACRAASTRYTLDRRKRFRSKGIPPQDDPCHGKWHGWALYKCRCERCFAAMREKGARTKYGMTHDEVAQAQGGWFCAICAKPVRHDSTGKDRAHIDHNHANGSVRGLLCGHCNMGLGHYDDSPERMRAAADYLERMGANPLVSPCGVHPDAHNYAHRHRAG